MVDRELLAAMAWSTLLRARNDRCISNFEGSACTSRSKAHAQTFPRRNRQDNPQRLLQYSGRCSWGGEQRIPCCCLHRTWDTTAYDSPKGCQGACISAGCDVYRVSTRCSRGIQRSQVRGTPRHSAEPGVCGDTRAEYGADHQAVRRCCRCDSTQPTGMNRSFNLAI